MPKKAALIPYSLNIKLFHDLLSLWATENKRSYPWMGIADPYRIWLSEVILQQTRVEQGLPYYLAFTKAFPTVCDLAAAEEDDVLRIWQGLGYYSRARNLHQTAREVCHSHGGVFPNSAEKLIQLKGIGPYTAAAIASFAFQQPVAAVDGNAIRVMARVFGIETPFNSSAGKTEFQELANLLLWKNKPGAFNQAMMDLGSGICKPKNPLCESCPLQRICVAKRNQRISLLPVKNQTLKRKNIYLWFLVILSGDQIVIQKRSETGIWAKLYQFPLVELSNPGEQLHHQLPLELENCELLQTTDWKKHLLTHRDVWHRFSVFRLPSFPKTLPNGWLLINHSELANFALPKPLENYIRSNSYIHH